VALIEAGHIGLDDGSEQTQHMRYAQQAGALAVILWNSEDTGGGGWQDVTSTFFPAVGIDDDDGRFIVAAINQGISKEEIGKTYNYAELLCMR
jgi:hypothetical protein